MSNAEYTNAFQEEERRKGRERERKER